jgi:hypothetical protein
MPRLFSLLLIAFLLVTSDGAEAAKRKRANGGGGGGGTQVYLLRGIFNVSVGLDALAQKLARRGIRSAVYGHGDAGTVAAQAIRDYRSGRVRSIILVGHSLGVGGAVMAANELAAAGVPVSLLISLDPVATLAVPGNVRRAVNYHISSGRALGAAPGFRGSLRNINMDGQGVDHMTIQSLDAMHRRLLGEIAGR